MKTIEKIRQKIEELYDGEAPAHAQQCDFDDGYFTGIGAISKFLDTLESEKPMNQDGLEEEIEMEWDSFSKHLAEYDDDDSDEVIWLNKFSFTDIARHFAKWGAEHLAPSKIII